MNKKLILLILLILMTFFTLYGCQDEQSSAFDSLANENSSSADIPEVLSIHEDPYNYNNLEELFADVALVKFDETNRFPNKSGSFYGLDDRNLFMLRELFMPRSVPRNVAPFNIIYFRRNMIIFEYFNRTRFIWYRNRTPDNFESIPTSEPGHIAWIQHGQGFSAHLHGADFTEQELYEFTYAQPVIAWQLQGNAVSVSVQGVKNVRISDEFDYEIVLEASPRNNNLLIRSSITLVEPSQDGQEWVTTVYPTGWLNHRTLYSIDGENHRIVGYRWRVNEESDRWQYVLESGTYIFRFENVVHDEVDLLVRHFDDHEIVSEVNHSEELIEQDISGFSIKVTPTDSFLKSSHC